MTDEKGPSSETLKGLAGMMSSAIDPTFNDQAAEIRAANTKVCAVCGQVFIHKESRCCSGCQGLLDTGQTALVAPDLRFVFVEFPEDGDNADLRGKIESVDKRVVDTLVAKAAQDESTEQA